MQMRFFLFALLFLCKLAWPATDLVAAWQAARTHDPSYRAEVAGAEAGNQKKKQATALWMPSLALQAGIGYMDLKNEVDGASFTAPALGSMSDVRFVTQIHQAIDARVGLVATMPIYSPARRASTVQLEQQARMSSLELRQSDQTLFLRVAQGYFDVLAGEDSLATLEMRKKAVQESLDIAKENFNLGRSASTDMHEAQAGFDGVLAEEAAVRNDLEYKRSVFSDLTGLPVTQLAHLRKDAMLESLRPADVGALIDRALAQNPMVQMSDTGRDIANQEVEKHRATSSLSVDLVAQYGQEHIGGSNGAGAASSVTRTGWVGVQLNVPLFTGGMRSAKEAEAVAFAEKARFDAENVRQITAQKVRSAYFALDTALQQIRAYEQGVASAARKLDATRTGQELGARTTSDVLNAQQAYFAVRNNLLRAHYQALLSALNLAAASGDLDVARLEAINAFLNTSFH